MVKKLLLPLTLAIKDCTNITKNFKSKKPYQRQNPTGISMYTNAKRTHSEPNPYNQYKSAALSVHTSELATQANQRRYHKINNRHTGKPHRHCQYKK